jgi:hypothetical protein
MNDFTPGERVFIDRTLPAVFIRYTETGAAVVQIGVDTRVVDPVILGRAEA